MASFPLDSKCGNNSGHERGPRGQKEAFDSLESLKAGLHADD